MCCLEEKHKGELRRMQDSTESGRDANPTSHSPLDSGKCSCLRKISAQKEEEQQSLSSLLHLRLSSSEAEQEVRRLMEGFSVLLCKRCHPGRGFFSQVRIPTLSDCGEGNSEAGQSLIKRKGFERRLMFLVAVMVQKGQ